MTKRIFSAFNPDMIIPAIQSNISSYLLIVLGFILHWLPASLKERLRGRFITLHWTAKVAMVALAVVLLLQFRTAEVVPFIYFRF
jgi:alginate O-acetyltransferase complex protein AlgI